VPRLRSTPRPGLRRGKPVAPSLLGARYLRPPSPRRRYSSGEDGRARDSCQFAPSPLGARCLKTSPYSQLRGVELAEGEGFEPPIRFPVQRFSRPPPSTTRPSLRAGFLRIAEQMSYGHVSDDRIVPVAVTPDDSCGGALACADFASCHRFTRPSTQHLPVATPDRRSAKRSGRSRCGVWSASRGACPPSSTRRRSECLHRPRRTRSRS
jgi:hypothetical protein